MTREPPAAVGRKARVHLKKLRRKLLHSKVLSAVRRRKVSTGSGAPSDAEASESDGDDGESDGGPLSMQTQVCEVGRHF